MKTLVHDPFENDVSVMLEWAYGKSAAEEFWGHRLGDQRVGQAFMNTLWVIDKEEYNRIHRSDVSPYYVDAFVPKALDLLTSK